MARSPSPRPSRRGPSPARDYAAEYRRRTAARAGKTKAELRGHAPKAGVKEHVSRRIREEKEEAAGGLTTAHRKQVKDFFRDQARMIRGADPADLEARGLRWVQGAGGWPAFKALRDETKELAQSKRARVRIRRRPGRAPVIELDVQGRAANRARMEAFALRWGIPDWRWLFYK